MIVDPEGEFGNLAEHIGAATIRASEIATDGLTAAALRARHHRLPLHLDLHRSRTGHPHPKGRCVLRRTARLAARGLGAHGPGGDRWLSGEADQHLLAPHVAASARDAETRRLGVATLTDLCARGRKRGISPVIATQRLAKLAASVVSELHNVLLGLNIFDRDVARAGDLLGFGSETGGGIARAAPRRVLRPRPGAVPAADAGADRADGDAARRRHARAGGLGRRDAGRSTQPARPGRAARGAPGPTPRSPAAPACARWTASCWTSTRASAARVIAALRAITPNATTAADLARHLGARDGGDPWRARPARLRRRGRHHATRRSPHRPPVGAAAPAGLGDECGGAGMMHILPFDVVELVPCPVSPDPIPAVPRVALAESAAPRDHVPRGRLAARGHRRAPGGVPGGRGFRGDRDRLGRPCRAVRSKDRRPRAAPQQQPALDRDGRSPISPSTTARKRRARSPPASAALPPRSMPGPDCSA